MRETSRRIMDTTAILVRLQVCMDDSADVLLAYKMNGKELSPDHGYPIRLIVPGYIGGRMASKLVLHVRFFPTSLPRLPSRSQTSFIKAWNSARNVYSCCTFHPIIRAVSPVR